MSPDSPETRLGRLETAVARLEQRTDDLATDVRTLAPLVIAVAEVKLTVSHIEADARSMRTSIEAVHYRMDKDSEERQRRQQESDTDTARDGRNFRRTLIGIGIAAVLSPVGTLVLGLMQNHPRK